MTAPNPEGDVVLTPCPFCAGAALLIEPRDSAPYVLCERCHAGGPVSSSAGVSEAVAAWNRRAALQPSPAAPSGWQSIETAPKDGTVVDLFYPDFGRWTSASWSASGWGRFEQRREHTVRVRRMNADPSHWMPLPPAPLYARQQAAPGRERGE